MGDECPHCGAKMVKYRHSMSHGLVRVLYKVWLEQNDAGIFSVATSTLTRNQAGNLQKLRYWGLIFKAPSDGKGGEWIVHKRAGDFLRGEIMLDKIVTTWRGEVIEREGRTVVTAVTGGWKYRPQWAQEALPL